MAIGTLSKGLAITIGLGLGVAAHAADWNFSYNGDGIVSSGILTTADIADSNGWFDIIGITGTRNAASIDGLLAPPYAWGSTWGVQFDNKFATSGPHVDWYGLGFTSAGEAVNLYFDAGQYFDVGVNHAGITPVHLSVSPVPEPGTYAMLIAGLGLTGLIARRRV